MRGVSAFPSDSCVCWHRFLSPIPRAAALLFRALQTDVQPVDCPPSIRYQCHYSDLRSSVNSDMNLSLCALRRAPRLLG
jgi:hypothetical protein